MTPFLTTRRPPDITDYIDMLRRYRAWLIAPAFAGLVTAVVAAYLSPDTYISSAAMRIVPQQIPDVLAPALLNIHMQQRLQSMQQQILSRGSLADLIQRPALDLYRKERASYPLEDVIQEMRAKAVRIQMLDAGAGRAANGFTIQFSYTDRFKAQAVVHELVNMFLQENSLATRKGAGAIADYVSETVKAAQEKMDLLDNRIAQFKAANPGNLPEQIDRTMAQLQGLETQRANANDALGRLQQSQMQMETQVQTAATQLDYYRSLTEEMAAGAAARNPKLEALNQRLVDAQTAMASARQTYTPQHPILRKAQAELESLEKQIDTEQQRRPGPAPSPQLRTNPAAIKMAQDAQATLSALRTEIQATRLQMADKARQIQELSGAIARLNTRIEGGPRVEQQYAALMRDYSLAKRAYDDTHVKQQLTKNNQLIDETGAGGETLEVLEPASDPVTPSEPNRLQIAATGTGLGLLLGVLLAGAKEMKNTSLKNLKDAQAYTNLPVLSCIPLLENALLIRRKRRLLWMAWTSALFLGGMAMSASAWFHYFGRAA